MSSSTQTILDAGTSRRLASSGIKSSHAQDAAAAPFSRNLSLQAVPDGSITRPEVKGRFLNVGGRRFWIKGVTYGTFCPNEDGEPFPSRRQVRDDFARMR